MSAGPGSFSVEPGSRTSNNGMCFQFQLGLNTAVTYKEEDRQKDVFSHTNGKDDTRWMRSIGGLTSEFVHL